MNATSDTEVDQYLIELRPLYRGQGDQHARGDHGDVTITVPAGASCRQLLALLATAVCREGGDGGGGEGGCGGVLGAEAGRRNVHHLPPSTLKPDGEPNLAGRVIANIGSSGRGEGSVLGTLGNMVDGDN